MTVPMNVPTLFDYNGVLVDDEDVHFAAFREALSPLGIALTEEAYLQRYLGYDDVGAFQAILVDAGRTPSTEDVRALVDAKKPLYLARIADLRTFPGAREIVERRAALGPVGIVSGALLHEIEIGLDKLGVRALIRFIVSAEDTAACKPDPEGYLEAVRRLGSLGVAAPAVAIEDSLAGVEAAKRAGLRCVAVAHTYAPFELARAGADVIVPSLSALTDEALAC
jgi:HAD superfamily hydrolase (TIGR01509 family)